jgi:DNA-directed RNA polymerase specialized sigma24 family protein
VQVALVERARAGDEEAFASLARAAGDRLLAIAYGILRDLGLAEDAVQQTLVLAIQRLIPIGSRPWRPHRTAVERS